MSTAPVTIRIGQDGADRVAADLGRIADSLDDMAKSQKRVSNESKKTERDAGNFFDTLLKGVVGLNQGLELLEKGWSAVQGVMDTVLRGATIREGVRNMGATQDIIEQTTEAALGLSKAFGTDMEQAAEQLRKTIGGYAGELGETIPALKQFTQEELRAGAAIEFVNQRFGEGATPATTFVGIMGELEQRSFRTADALGSIVEVNEQFLALMAQLRDAGDAFGDTLDRNADDINSFVSGSVLFVAKSVGFIIESFMKLRVELLKQRRGFADFFATVTLGMADIALSAEIAANRVIKNLNSILPESMKLKPVFLESADTLTQMGQAWAETFDEMLGKEIAAREGLEAFQEEFANTLRLIEQGTPAGTPLPDRPGRAPGAGGALSAASGADTGAQVDVIVMDIERISAAAINGNEQVSAAAVNILSSYRSTLAAIVQDALASGEAVSEAVTTDIMQIDGVLKFLQERGKETIDYMTMFVQDYLGTVSGALSALSEFSGSILNNIDDNAAKTQRVIGSVVKTVTSAISVMQAVQSSAAAAGQAQAATATASGVTQAGTLTAAYAPAAGVVNAATFGGGAIAAIAAIAGLVSAVVGIVSSISAAVADKGVLFGTSLGRAMGLRGGENQLVFKRRGEPVLTEESSDRLAGLLGSLQTRLDRGGNGGGNLFLDGRLVGEWVATDQRTMDRITDNLVSMMRNGTLRIPARAIG